MVSRGRWRRRWALVAASAVLLTGGIALPGGAAVLSTPAPVEDRPSTGVSADTLPTVQIDTGVVWDQAVVGNTVFAGGQFTQTRPAGAERGQQLTPRSNLLSYDIRTGKLLPFAPNVNGVVKVVTASPDGSRLYIGGSFSQVDGQPRWGIAAFDVATGRLTSDFNPGVGGSFVSAIVVTDSTVYIGGLFTQVSGVARRNLAAVDLRGNLSGWSPTTDQQVDAMVRPNPSRLVISGRFGTVNGSTALGSAALDPQSGASLAWALNKSQSTGIINGGSSTSNSATMGLDTDGTNVYGAAWQHGAPTGRANIEGMWAANANTGQLVWMTAGMGDQYDLHVMGSLVYGVGHAHDASEYGGWPDYKTPSGNYQDSTAVTAEAKGTNTRGGYWDNSGKPAPALTHWYPNWISGSFTGMGQAGWTVEGNSDYVVIGGEFIGVNGQLQTGLARFARTGVDGSGSGPRLIGATGAWENPSFTARPAGGTITIRPNFDRDDRTLTYELYRSGTTKPVARATFASDSWLRTSQTVNLIDSSANGNTWYTYTVKAVDRDGNSATSNPVSGFTGAGNPLPAKYSAAVLADGPSLYWRMDGSAATRGLDAAGSNNAVVGSGVSTAASPAIAGSGTGSSFDGTANGTMGSSRAVASTNNVSTEVWFKTNTTRGGKLTGFGNQQLTSSNRNDRHIYMLNDGRLSFGVYTGEAKVVTTGSAYNDGNWHQAVATLGSTGMRLYVDGVLRAVDTSVTASIDSYNGYWRVGGDNLLAWPTIPSSYNFAGDLDEFSVYPKVLTAQQVSDHYTVGLNNEPEETGPVAGDVLVKDTFTRTASSWGTTDNGKAWKSDSGMTTADGKGLITLAGAAQQRSAWLNSIDAKDVDITMDVAFDKGSAGGGTYISAAARHTDAGDYRLKTVLNSDQSVTLYLVKVVRGTETILSTQVLKGYRYAVGDTLRLRFAVQTSGAATTVQAKGWQADGSEPDAWQMSGTDSDPALTGSGSIGVIGYLSGASTIAPQTIRIDNFNADAL